MLGMAAFKVSLRKGFAQFELLTSMSSTAALALFDVGGFVLKLPARSLDHSHATCDDASEAAVQVMLHSDMLLSTS
jgi:hypothetical protein